jgi:hypothetical protein
MNWLGTDRQTTRATRQALLLAAWFAFAEMTVGFSPVALAVEDSLRVDISSYTRSYVILPKSEADPVQALDSDKDLRLCGHTLNGIFLDRGLYVISPRAGITLDERLRATGIIAERKFAETAEIFASRLLADVEVRFTLRISQTGILGNAGITAHVLVECLCPDSRGFTAEGIATGANNSKGKSTVIREAALLAGTRLLDQLAVMETVPGKRPRTLRVIAQFSEEVTDRQHACPRRALLDAMQESSGHVKENVITARTIDCWIYLADADSTTYPWVDRVMETFEHRCDQQLNLVLMRDNLVLLKVIIKKPSWISPPTEEKEK